MKLVWLNIVITVACANSEYCRPGQKGFGGSCYQLLNEKMTWQAASTACSDMGGGLAVPDSPGEDQFIWQMFTATIQEGNVWIGCTDMEEEGKWVQAGEEGQGCNYFNWAPGEPNQWYKQQDNCIEMWRNREGLWNDDRCDIHNFVICEYPAIPSPALEMLCLQADASGHFTSQY